MSYQPGAVEFRFEVQGEVQIAERFEGMIRRVEDCTPALEQIATHFYTHMEQAFDTGGSATRATWAPLAERYARWKAKHYPGLPVLTRKGALRRSLSSASAPGSLRRITPDSLEIGTTLAVPSGRWNLGGLHQEGLPPVPQRKIINLPDDVTVTWMGYLRAHMSWEK